MVLYKLEDFDPGYQDSFDRNDIKGYDVYADRNNEKIGSVKNILVDEAGHFRYLVVDTGFWVFGKQVLLPIGRSRIDQNDRRIYAIGLTKEQAEQLPEFTDDLKIDDDYEESVRGIYRDRSVDVPPVAATTQTDTYDRSTYKYQQEPSLYEMNQQDHQTLKLYEERLVANKTRRKTGEVVIGKHVETETERVSIPIEKEQVIVERVTPTNAGRPVAPGEATFAEGEVARMEIYEETPDIHKEAVLREEVRVKKQVEQDTVNAEETLRREELDVDTQDRSTSDKNKRGFNK